MMPSQRRSAGFTLVELLVVLVLVGIGVGIAAFSVDRLADRARERQWLDRTHQELKRLRNRAVLSGQAVDAVVRFDSGELRQQGGRAVVRLPENYRFARAQATGADDLQLASEALRFFPDGSVKESRFFLETPSGTRYGFHLAQVSGRIATFDAQQASSP